MPVQARVFQVFLAAAWAVLGMQWSGSFVPLRISDTGACVIIIYLHPFR